MKIQLKDGKIMDAGDGWARRMIEQGKAVPVHEARGAKEPAEPVREAEPVSEAEPVREADPETEAAAETEEEPEKPKRARKKKTAEE